MYVERCVHVFYYKGYIVIKLLYVLTVAMKDHFRSPVTETLNNKQSEITTVELMIGIDSYVQCFLWFGSCFEYKTKLINFQLWANNNVVV